MKLVSRKYTIIVFLGILLLSLMGCSDKAIDACSDLDFTMDGLNFPAPKCDGFMGVPTEKMANYYYRSYQDQPVKIELPNNLSLEGIEIKVDEIKKMNSILKNLDEGMHKISVCSGKVCAHKFLFIDPHRPIASDYQPPKAGANENAKDIEKPVKASKIVIQQSSQQTKPPREKSDTYLSPIYDRSKKPNTYKDWEWRSVDGRGQWTDVTNERNNRAPVYNSNENNRGNTQNTDNSNPGTNSSSSTISSTNSSSSSGTNSSSSSNSISQENSKPVVNDVPNTKPDPPKETKPISKPPPPVKTKPVIKAPEYLSNKSKLSVRNVFGCNGELNASKRLITLRITPKNYIELVNLKVKSSGFSACTLSLRSKDGKDQARVNQEISNQDTGSELSLLGFGVMLRPNIEYTLTLQSSEGILNDLSSCSSNSSNSNSNISIAGDTEYVFDIKYRH